MDIKKVSGLFTAEIIAKILQNDEHLPHNTEAGEKYWDPYMQSYQNGREQGLTIAGLDNMMVISFAEHRNSDSIVVYCGMTANQGLSDEAWKNSKMFAP